MSGLEVSTVQEEINFCSLFPLRGNTSLSWDCSIQHKEEMLHFTHFFVLKFYS